MVASSCRPSGGSIFHAYDGAMVGSLAVAYAQKVARMYINSFTECFIRHLI